MSAAREPITAVRSVIGGKWHAPAHQPSGYGVWTICGRSWPEANYSTSRERQPDCRRCAAAREKQQ